MVLDVKTTKLLIVFPHTTELGHFYPESALQILPCLSDDGNYLLSLSIYC